MSTPVRKRAQHIVCSHSRSRGQYIHIILDRPMALFKLCFTTLFYQMYGFCSKSIHKSLGEFDILVEKGTCTCQNRYIFHIYFYVQHKHCKTSQFKKKGFKNWHFAECGDGFSIYTKTEAMRWDHSHKLQSHAFASAHTIDDGDRNESLHYNLVKMSLQLLI